MIFFGVLYHLRDPMLALAQIRSVVKEDGLVLLVGRIGAVLKPIPASSVAPDVAYEINVHYKGGIPRIG